MFFSYVTFLTFIFAATLAYAETVNGIKVIGNHFIDTKKVIDASGLKVGESMDNAAVVIGRLNDQLDIETASISTKDGAVLIEIKELPRITKIQVNVSSGISKDIVKRILKEQELQPNQAIDYAKVQRVVDILTGYIERQGYIDVGVSVDYNVLANNQIVLTFDIASHQGYTIRGIHFNGQQTYTARQLQQICGLAITGLLSPLTGDDYYSSSRLQVAVENIKEAYANKGFYAVQITPNITKFDDSKQVQIFFEIQEGDVSRIHQLDFKNLGAEVVEKVKALGLETGAPFSRLLIKEAEKLIEQSYKNDGRYASEVEVKAHSWQKNQVNLTFEVRQAPRVNVRFIQIEGNRKTEDQILRHYFDVVEGDLYSQSKLDRSIEKLKALAFLEKVDCEVKPVKGKADQVDLRIKVKESSSSTISLKGSYDKFQGPVFTLQYTDKNFLGTGNLFDVNLEKASNGRQSYHLNWLNPVSIINPRWSESVSLGYDSVFSQTDDIWKMRRYQTTSFSFGFSEFIPVGNNLNFILGVQPAFRSIGNAQLGSIAYLFEQQYGKSFKTLGLKTGFRGQYYDSVFGNWSADLSLVHSPKWLQAVSYTKLSSRVEGQVKLISYGDQDVILNPIFKFGYGANDQGGSLPYFEKFKIGSDVILRGFDSFKVGPYYEYTTLENDGFGNMVNKTIIDYLGGTQFAGLNLNLWLPSPSPEAMIPGLYADVVSMRSEYKGSGLRSSAGLAMKINTPMGIVQVAYALSMNPVGDQDQLDRFWISMSGSL
jgi:outer membrane protein insertion porin family